MLTTVRKLMKKSLSAKAGRVTFPARAGQYSQFIWDFKCFSGIDHIENPDEDGIFKIVNDYTGEGWNDQVDDELG